MAPKGLIFEDLMIPALNHPNPGLDALSSAGGDDRNLKTGWRTGRNVEELAVYTTSHRLFRIGFIEWNQTGKGARSILSVAGMSPHEA
jgi:hypothetical protein